MNLAEYIVLVTICITVIIATIGLFAVIILRLLHDTEIKCSCTITTPPVEADPEEKAHYEQVKKEVQEMDETEKAKALLPLMELVNLMSFDGKSNTDTQVDLTRLRELASKKKGGD